MNSFPQIPMVDLFAYTVDIVQLLFREINQINGSTESKEILNWFNKNNSAV